jgi:hypothetical protein
MRVLKDMFESVLELGPMSQVGGQGKAGLYVPLVAEQSSLPVVCFRWGGQDLTALPLLPAQVPVCWYMQQIALG